MPANNDTPKIANISQATIITIMTLKMLPMDSNKAVTRVFIAMLCEMNLKGLRVLSNLKILIIGALKFNIITSKSEVTTMKKSMIFQISRK